MKMSKRIVLIGRKMNLSDIVMKIDSMFISDKCFCKGRETGLNSSLINECFCQDRKRKKSNIVHLIK